MTTATAPHDAKEIADWLRVLLEPGQVVELRAIDVTEQYGSPTTHSGYYQTDHLLKMATDAVALTKRCKAVWWLLNPVHPDLLARRANREAKLGKDDKVTGDADIICRRLLMVDADPKKIAGVSATDDEKEHARQVITDIDSTLADAGWPAPIMADSGNGYHLLYRIDLPVDDGDLVKRCLMALAHRFGSDHVIIDTANANPSRACKLYGTMARKGDGIPSRPHRRSEIITIPEQRDVVPIELLERLAAQAPIEAPKQIQKTNGHSPRSANQYAGLSPGDDFAARGDVRSILTKHGWTSTGGGDNEHWSRPGKDGGTSATLKDGNFHVFTSSVSEFQPNSDHNPFSVYAMLEHGGDFTAAARQLAAEGYGSPKSNGSASPRKSIALFPIGARVKCTDGGHTNFGTVANDDGGPKVTVDFVSREGVAATSSIKREAVSLADGMATGEPFKLNLMTSEQFLDADFRQHFLVKRLLVEGQCCVLGGPKKVLKTSLLVDLAVSLASGTPFLSHPDFCVPDIVPVMLLSGESGGFTLRETAKRIALARSRMLSSAPIFWGFDLPQLGDSEHLAALADEIKKHAIKVCIIDPAYLCLLSAGMNSNITANVFAMGAVLKELSEIGRQTGCTIIIAHHTRKADR